MEDKPNWSEAIVKTTDLLKPIVETGCDFAKSLLGKPLSVAGNLIADEIYAWQVGNRLRICAKTKEKLEQAHVPPRVVPKGFLLPLLDACGNIEDPTLQEMWANLLASGVAEDDFQHPMYEQVLKQMSVSDARIFCAMNDRSSVTSFDNREYHTPEGIAGRERLIAWGLLKRNIIVSEPRSPIRADSGLVPVARPLGSMPRLRVDDSMAHVSSLGKTFYLAVSGKALEKISEKKAE